MTLFSLPYPSTLTHTKTIVFYSSCSTPTLTTTSQSLSLSFFPLLYSISKLHFIILEQSVYSAIPSKFLNVPMFSDLAVEEFIRLLTSSMSSPSNWRTLKWSFNPAIALAIPISTFNV